MSIHEITYYQAKCDVCGYIETDYGEHSALLSPAAVWEDLEDWALIGDTALCPKCTSCEVCDNPAAHVVGEHLTCSAHQEHRFPAFIGESGARPTTAVSAAQAAGALSRRVTL